MSDDIQKETERIHHGIVESLSFSEALAKHDAEIERLRREISDLNAGWQRTYDYDTNWLKSEIERLRREHEKAWADAQLKAAEIERLRGDFDDRHWRTVRAEAALAKAQSEYADLDALRHTACDQRDAYKAEIERLREENIRHHSWFQAEVERRAAAERKQHAAEAEIERLRSLLRETLPYFGMQAVAHGLQAPHPLGVRIRKVLGDVPDA